MRTRQTPAGSARRLAALLASMALVAAACGSDDDVADNSATISTDASEEDADDESETTVNAAPEWAADPDEVRANSVVLPSGTPDPPETTASYDERECWIRQDRVAVDASAQADVETHGFTLLEEGEQHSETGVLLYASADPLADSLALLADDIAASPVYLLFPAPARMFFPGTLPVPSDVTLPAAGTAGTGASVLVIDTGGYDGFGAMTELDADTPPAGNVAAPFTFGHGAFVSSVIRQVSGAEVTHVRIDPLTTTVNGDDVSLGYWDESQLDLALRRFVDRGGFPSDFDVANMSFGTFPCFADGVRLDPLLTLTAITTYFEPGQFIVAAAGNSGDDRVTVPAAFATPDPADWGAAWISVSDTIAQGSDEDAPTYARVADLLGELGATMFAVGATPDRIHDSSYSTTGSWVTHTRPGCHDAEFPAGFDIDYPAGESVPAVSDVELGSTVYWCGTSFAAPVLSAEIACVLGGLSDGEREPEVVGEVIAATLTEAPTPDNAAGPCD